MGLVHIDSVVPGMTLASDLKTPEGRFLLPKGAVLKENIIKTCKAWGVRQAEIVGQDQEQLNEDRLARIDPEHLEKSWLLLSPLLRCADADHPAMGEIIRIAVERTARRLASGESFPVQDREELSLTAPPDPPLSLEDGVRAARNLVQGETSLISLPATFYKIMKVMESPYSSALHIAEVVGKDSSLAAKLLKLVNSAFYGFPSKVDSISRAVALVGTRELTSLALGISVITVFDGIPATVMDMEGFWKHSISCGVYASLIASSRQGRADERFFVAGLLHDLGRLLMVRKHPGFCLDALGMSRRQGVPAFMAEQRYFGYDHARVGGMLCKAWRIPATIEQMIRHHHDPFNSRHVVDASTIHLANSLAMVAGAGASGEGVLPPLQEAAWDCLKLNTSDLAPMVLQAQRQITEIQHIFLHGEQ